MAGRIIRRFKPNYLSGFAASSRRLCCQKVEPNVTPGMRRAALLFISSLPIGGIFGHVFFKQKFNNDEGFFFGLLWPVTVPMWCLFNTADYINNFINERK